MSTDLQTQMRHLAGLLDAGQDPVTADEIRQLVEGRDDTEPFVGPVPTGRGLSLSRRPWPAVVAAVVVLLLFGALAWMLPSEEPVPPADSFVPASEHESGYYTTSAVPEGFVLQDTRTLGESSLLFLREFEDRWVPSDGGFAIHGIGGRPFGLPEDPGDYLNQTLAAVPGSTSVEVGGRPAILHETQFSQGDLTFPLIWVLAVDDQGGLFEVVAAGLSRGEVLAVADGVQRISVEDFVELGSQIKWDVRVSMVLSGFEFSPPSRVTELADDVDTALGVDLLLSRLASAGGESTVITTQDGEIVDSFGQAITASSAALYLDVPAGGEDAVVRAYPGHADLSPARREARIDGYIEQLRGGRVLSEAPYVIQAARGPKPSFDPSELGEELPLVPETSTGALPEFMFDGPADERAAATEDRPVIILGTAGQPNSDASPVTILVYFTETGVICVGTATDNGMGTGCGFEIDTHFGDGGGSSEESSEGVTGEVNYIVPLETSVVQIATESLSYWQRPIGGYGVVPFGNTVERPTSITAFDADGNEIGSWAIGSR
jgi:hypothetical protein